MRESQKYKLRWQLINAYQLRFLFNRKLHYPDKKFIIIGLGRNGTTLLASLLNQHLAIYCDSEIFLRKYDMNHYWPKLYVKSLSRKAELYDATHYGFQLKVGQLVSNNKMNHYHNFLDRLYHQGWKIINVQRYNIVKHAFSLYKALQEDIYEVKDGMHYNAKKLHVNPSELKSLIHTLEWNYKIEQKTIKDFRQLRIVYEDDLLNSNMHQITANKVFDFLEIEHAEVKTEFKKTSADKFLENITNPEEVKDYFKNTYYEKYLYL